MTAAATPRTCGCGCPGVPSAGGRFLRGHNKLVATVEKLTSHCQACGGRIDYAPYNSKPRYCDRTCQADAKRKLRAPRLPLGQFVIERWRASGQSLSAFARAAGVTRQVLTDVLDDRLPTECTLTALAAALGPLPPSETETARRKREYPVVLAAYGHLGRTAEVQARAAAARRGRKRSPTAIANVKAALEASGAMARFGAAAARFATHRSGRAARAIAAYGRWHDLTVDRVDALAETVAHRLGMSKRAVTTAWHPLLQQRHLLRPVGPPTLEERCRLVRQLRAGGASWDQVFDAVKTRGMKAPRSTEELRDWWKKHRQRCRAANPVNYSPPQTTALGAILEGDARTTA